MKFCERPFNFIHLDPNGGCRLCAWTDISIGNLVYQDLEDIWNSESAVKIREAIKKGNFEYCRKTSCPFLENDSLPEIEAEVVKNIEPEQLPTKYSVACDFTCNHSCPSCRNEIFRPDEEYKKNLNIILEKILPYLNRAETEKIITDGNGDCFASPYIMNMLEQLRPKNKACRITFETNGALLDEEHWSRIEHLAEYWIQVTITPNSFVKTTFEYLNGGIHSYEKVMSNLLFVKALREKGIINWTRISIVLQERNFWEFPEFARRCLDEFAADEVVAKPLYRWFMLSQDDYWFKDIMNPMHPYHKEYLQMLENPILKDSRIFYWGAHNLHESRRHPAYIYKEYVEIIDKLLSDENSGKKIEKQLMSEKKDSVYLYGDTELTTAFCCILKDTNIQIKGIIARDISNKQKYGFTVHPLCDYVPMDEDVFIVMNYPFIKEILRDLHFKGFKGNVISVKDLVLNIYN